MEKKTSYVGVIVFIIIFAVIAVGTTFWLASLQNKKNSMNIGERNPILSTNEVESEKNEVIEVVLGNDKIETDKVVDDSNLVVKNFGIETYFENNLIIKNEVYHEGEYFDRDLETYNVKEVNYPLQVNYVQIDGLKNKNIQDQINFDLKNKAINLARKLNIESEVIAVSSNVMGNFSNILSVFMKCYEEEESDSGQYSYLSNLRL